MRTQCRPSLLFLVAVTVVRSWGASATAQEFDSHYVAMADGVRLAVDVHLPPERAPGAKFPAILELTRYWRSAIDPQSGRVVQALSPIDRGFLRRGYAIVKVDVRGSGASFGFRLEEYGPAEIRDGYAIVDWVAKQAWCDGNVGAYGTSYSGTTAELLAASRHPALKAVIPGWSDFDVYASPCRPYGLVPEAFLNDWSEMVGRLDRNAVDVLGTSVKPVDPTLLSQAVAEHQKNPEVARMEANLEFRDSEFEGARPLGECTSLFWKSDIEESEVPMLVLASWLDAGTADGALLRFQNYRNRQYLVILASSHGGMHHASPYVVGDQVQPPIPSAQDQFNLRLAFFDHYLQGEANGVPEWPAIRYFNLGEEKMRESAVWPPAGTELTPYFLASGNTLAAEPPNTRDSSQAYRVDFDVQTGAFNRWTTQMGRPILSQDHRESQDARLLCYDTPALAAPLQITGSVEVDLAMSSSADDGYVLCYLEDVAPDGQSRYLTEGGLRFLHRKPNASPLPNGDGMYHSFAQRDAMPVVPGETMQVGFRLWPVSVQIAAGHRLRLAIAGCDRRVFGRIPAESEVEFKVFHDSAHPSQIRVPIVTPNAD